MIPGLLEEIHMQQLSLNKKKFRANRHGVKLETPEVDFPSKKLEARKNNIESPSKSNLVKELTPHLLWSVVNIAQFKLKNILNF